MNKHFFYFPLLIIATMVSSSNLTLAAELGQAMPDCTLTKIDTNEASVLSQFKGKVLFVDFWASWCGPCAKSFPFLNGMHQQLKEKGLRVVGVNLDENPDDAKGFLGKFPVDFTVMVDASKQCAKDFQVKAMPSSYVIDREGKVQHVHLGFKPGEAKEIQVIVEKLLVDKATGF